jgi:hypothetical protein
VVRVTVIEIDEEMLDADGQLPETLTLTHADGNPERVYVRRDADE